MNARMRPIGCTAGMPMLDRVEVNVVDVALEIPVIAQHVFPESMLPDAAISNWRAKAAPYRAGTGDWRAKAAPYRPRTGDWRAKAAPYRAGTGDWCCSHGVRGVTGVRETSFYALPAQ